MQIQKIYCDKCGTECGDMRVAVTRFDKKGIGYSDYCFSCYERMLSALKKEDLIDEIFRECRTCKHSRKAFARHINCLIWKTINSENDLCSRYEKRSEEVNND